jgi:hypothetical protein
MAALLPGDAQAQAQLEKYTTELLQLNLGIAATSDEFHDLKIASLDALENGLAQGIDDSVTGAKSLSEAWALAAESILHSIQRVISQLLAQIAVQRIAKALGLFDGSAGDDGSGALIDAIVAQGVPGISVIGGKAAGGVIRGPGTGTSDSILARVSNGEGFLTARTVQRIGESGVNALNAGNALVVRRFAEGGVVGATTLSGAAGGIHGRLDGQISLAPGLIGDFLRSPEGVDIQITNLHANRNRVRSIVGTS